MNKKLFDRMKQEDRVEYLLRLNDNERVYDTGGITGFIILTASAILTHLDINIFQLILSMILGILGFVAVITSIVFSKKEKNNLDNEFSERVK